MNLKLSLFLCFLISCYEIQGKSLHQLKAGCSFNLDISSPLHPPHILDSNNEIVQPILVTGVRTLNLDEGQQVNVACIGNGNYLGVTGLQENPAVCQADSTLLINGVSYSYAEVGCLSQVKETLLENGTCTADGAGTNIAVGWSVGTNFVPLFEMCHDRVTALNYFSTDYVIGRSIDANDKGNTAPSFSQGGYYPGLDVNTLYTQRQQTVTIAGIVGSDALAAQYVNVSANLYLSRGHLAPDGDFIDAASQDASYYFMNVAPQWMVFNNGNWRILETAIRTVAADRDITLKIYTGTFSVMTLADVNGNQQEIYLGFDSNNNGLIPAPKYFWKLVHDTAANTATAFIGINNPHLPEVTADDIICPNVCDQIPWVDWDLTNIVKGYMFCCDAKSLKNAISFAPDLDVPLFV